MAKPKRKLTAAEKAAKKRRREEYMTVLINGKQKRQRRPPTIDGMDVDEFIRRNADPIWLYQNEMWEYIEPIPAEPWQQDNRSTPQEDADDWWRAMTDEEAEAFLGGRDQNDPGDQN
jgi:hypothetical protein